MDIGTATTSLLGCEIPEVRIRKGTESGLEET